MAILNLKTITKAIEKLLKAGLLPKYKNLTIQRNRLRNENPNKAATGWIGIYKGPTTYEAYTMGPKTWRGFPTLLIEIQYSNPREETAEDKLHDIETDVLDILATNPNLDLEDTVSFTAGFDLDYEILSTEGASPYWHSSLITLKTEVRT